MSNRRQRRKASARLKAGPSPVVKPSPRHWIERVDRPLEILLCVGHIVAAISLVVEHLS